MSGNHKVEITGVDTSQLPVLTNAEMQEFFRRMQEGDLEARERLIYGNLRLVLSVVQRFSHRGENMDDLFQVGVVGLIKAIDNFDLSHGVRFSTYAVPMIVGEIRRYLRDNGALRVSRSLRDIAYRALNVRDRLLGERSIEPTVDEIAAELSLSREEVILALEAIQEPVSLFEPIYQDGGDPIYLMDQVHDERAREGTWVTWIALREALRALGPRERLIVTKRFFEGKTQMEIAEEIGISQAQVSRLEKNALRHMQKHVDLAE
ncbi:MAG: RNA polymerase sporulation specific sigma factor SigG [Brockia lithotrophica]|uniref:RNA polymerase sigma factor n=1 Tax=Brockia lithotrophica TaxID=933949 RepID=A0A2T5G8D4_9BACL|nr:RNA polymerase sporulation sigma factor SigG [Brockia lithotrophica]PTQ52452.1 MAG: RNA polymerase sporulation specific sigma factor SigG [Brockia lithotrophica]